MKKLALVLAVLAGLFVAAGVALTHFLSPENLADQAIERVRVATGRELAFERPPRLSFFPNLGLRLRKVTLSDVSSAEPMVTLKELNLQLALKSLLEHRVEVTALTFDKPVIHLRRGTDGRANWIFARPRAAETGGGEAAPPAQQEGPVSQAGAAGEKKPSARDLRNTGYDFRFGKMQMSGGIVDFADARTGAHQSFSNLNLTLTWPDFSSTLQLDGEFDYNKTRVNLVVSLAQPLEFFSGAASDGDLRVELEGFKGKIEGRLAPQGTLLDGKLEASLESLPALADRLGLRRPGLPFENISFSSAATVSAKELALTGAALTLGDVKAGGDVTVGLQGRPRFDGKLSVDHLDLSRFSGMKKDNDAGKGATAAGGGTNGAASGNVNNGAASGAGAGEGTDDAADRKPVKMARDWDTKPIDFAGLRAADAHLTIATQGFTVKGAQAGPCTLTLALDNGRLVLSSTPADFFGGKASATLTVDAGAEGPPLGLKVKLEGVRARPLLTVFAHFNKLDGGANADFDLTSAGDNAKAIAGALQGHVAFDLHNGTLQGVDLLDAAREIQKLSNPDVADGATQFVDLTGTFKVTDGVAHNSDLRMRGPLVVATGSGTVDVGRRYVDYRFLPRITSSTEAEAKGVVVPVDIRGPFGAVTAKADFKSVLNDLAGSPEKLGNTLNGLRDQGNKIMGGMRKNGLLNNLFGGGGGGGQ